jgi:hypothetical protein
MQARLLRALERVLEEDEIWYEIRRGVYGDLEWERDFTPTRQAELDDFARRVTAASLNPQAGITLAPVSASGTLVSTAATHWSAPSA